ncbi:MAG: BspA family leucine-rich repeat surface protein [Eubacterium sp.]|nr:BspA family leucine-rich repeat surface protein [Eubacterium sp.]
MTIIITTVCLSSPIKPEHNYIQKKDYESSLVKTVFNEYQKDYYAKKIKRPSLSCIVFENEMKVYDGEDLFRYILGNGYSDLPRSSQLKYYGIYGIEKIDFSNVKSFRAMFADSFKVSGPMNIYLPECFKITNADTLNYMFAYSGYPEYKVTLTLPDSFDTSKVRNFRDMFAGTKITTLNLPPKFVFTQNQNSTKTEVDGFFYASNIKTINNATQFNTTNVTGCMCIPRNATLKTHKKYIDELDFTNVDGIGLILYGVSDSETINYVLAKVEKEAKNNPRLFMTCCEIKTDQLVFGFTKNTNTNLSGLFDGAKIGSVTIKPRTISDASEMFENADVKTIDVSACTFTESCSFENMFRSWMGGIPTIYVKDAATQKRFIDAFNADNDKLKITDKNVIIKK